MSPVVVSRINFLVYSAYKVCLSRNCLTSERDVSWPNWVPCQVFKGRPFLHHTGVRMSSPWVLFQDYLSVGGKVNGDLPAASPGPSWFRALKRLISLLSFSSWSCCEGEVLKPIPFCASLGCSLSLPNSYCVKT